MVETNTLNAIRCKNCEAEVTENYCPSCGQKRGVERITWRSVFDESLNGLIGFDHGLFHTVKSMAIAPGHTVRRYLAGHRKPFTKPVQFYLLMLTLYFIFTSLIGVDMNEIYNQMNQSFAAQSKYTPEYRARMQQFQNFFYTNFKVVSSIMVLLTAIVLRLLYRKAGFNLTEVLAFTLFIFGNSYLISSVMMIFYLKPEHAVMKAGMYLSYATYFVYLVWSIRQFFANKGGWAYVKATFTVLLAFLFYGVVSAIIMFAYTFDLLKSGQVLLK